MLITGSTAVFRSSAVMLSVPGNLLSYVSQYLQVLHPLQLVLIYHDDIVVIHLLSL